MILPPQTQPSISIRSLLRDKLTYGEKAADADVPVRELSVTEAQPIYTSDIDALLQGTLLAKATPAAWQYVLVAGDELQGVIELTAEKAKAGDPKTFSVLRPPEYAVILNEAISRAERLEGDYELRILRVPAVSLTAVWLKGNRNDLLLPLVPPSPQSLRRRVLTAEQLTKELTPLAIQRRDTSDE